MVELLRMLPTQPLCQCLTVVERGRRTGRSVDDTVFNLTDDDFNSQQIWYEESDGTVSLLPSHDQRRLKIVACFCWYLTFLCECRTDEIDLTSFRKNQFDDFLICEDLNERESRTKFC